MVRATPWRVTHVCDGDAITKPEGLARRAGRSLERAIGADVHAGEWRVVLLFFANLFLLLTAYYILKVIREPLILVGGGAVSRSYARGLQAGLLGVVIPLYGLIANRVEPGRLVAWIVSFFVVCLLTFIALGHAGVPIGFAFFVWLGIFSTLSIAQFWSLANDLMTEAEGKRLFPLIAVGGTLGAIAGAQIAARAIRWLDPFELMLAAAGLLAVCIVLTTASRRMGTSHRAPALTALLPEERDRRGGFTLLLRDRYLLLIATSVLILNFVNTTGDFILAEIVNRRAHDLSAVAAEMTSTRGRFITSFYGDYQTWVSGVTAFVQILLVTRAFKTVGVARSLWVAPLVAVAGYGGTLLWPTLAFMVVVKVIENSNDYSLQNTLQQALFLPTSRDVKYKAKAAIDTTCVRLGDLGSTVLVIAGTHAGLGLAGYAATNFVAGVIWLFVIARLVRRYRARTKAANGTPSS